MTRANSGVRTVTLAVLSLVVLCSCDSASPKEEEPTVVASDISVDTTWSAGAYEITTGISVTSAAALTIEPGVTVYLDEMCWLDVEEGATIHAEGTESQPITFKGVNHVEWDCVTIWEGSRGNTFSYCGFADGGCQGNCAVKVGALSGYCTAEADIRHCTFSNNAAGDLDASEAGPTTITSCTFGSAVSPLLVNDNVTFDKTNTFNSSTAATNCITLYQSTLLSTEGTLSIFSTRTLDITSVPYYIALGDLCVEKGASLTVAPGVTIKFGYGAGLIVKDGAQFTAVGTPDSAITFTASDSDYEWRCIEIQDGASSDTTVKYCAIRYAGYDGSYAIRVGGTDHTAGTDIEHCTVADNRNGGINAASCDGSRTTISNCTFSGNGTASGVGPFDIYYDDSYAAPTLDGNSGAIVGVK